MNIFLRSLTLLLVAPATAQTIDFENIPGVVGEAPEGLQIRDQFVSTLGVRFGRMTGTTVLPATLAKIGPKVPGYQSPTVRAAFLGVSRPDYCDGNGDGQRSESTNADMPLATLPYDPGCFLLTDDGMHGGNSPEIQPFLIEYVVPVLQASGYILDIDEEEAFTISARGEGGVQVADNITLDTDSRGAGNGNAAYWCFDSDEPIHSILITHTGTGSSKGIAFDEFSPSSMCPGSTVHRGGGQAGTNGLTPGISVDCPVVGQGGTIAIFNGLGGAHGVLGISTTADTRDYGCGRILRTTSWDFPHTLSGVGPGQGRFSMAYPPIDVSLVGTDFFLQAGYCDGGATCGETSLTEVLEMRIR